MKRILQPLLFAIFMVFAFVPNTEAGRTPKSVEKKEKKVKADRKEVRQALRYSLKEKRNSIKAQKHKQKKRAKSPNRTEYGPISIIGTSIWAWTGVLLLVVGLIIMALLGVVGLGIFGSIISGIGFIMLIIWLIYKIINGF